MEGRATNVAPSYTRGGGGGDAEAVALQATCHSTQEHCLACASAAPDVQVVPAQGNVDDALLLVVELNRLIRIVSAVHVGLLPCRLSHCVIDVAACRGHDGGVATAHDAVRLHLDHLLKGFCRVADALVRDNRTNDAGKGYGPLGRQGRRFGAYSLGKRVQHVWILHYHLALVVDTKAELAQALHRHRRLARHATGEGIVHEGRLARLCRAEAVVS
uniref:Uncharacterized protein n=1 Tax=Leishmania guyanensis TaxID=5670 RepID=A0A1E1J9E7_LEIGU|nr:Hypothetical protein BN36_NA77520 [Leishmania guyanensis]